MLRAAAVLLALVPALAVGAERVLLLKTFEDEAYPTDPSLCSPTPGVRKLLGASVWSLQTNAARGEVMNDEVRRLGSVAACATITSLDPYAPKQYFTIRFELADATYVAQGQCDMVGKDFPAPGLALVGCALGIVQSSDGARGFATSSTVFVLGEPVAGYGTGSVWTLHLYTQD
ncbi:MAG TPA: hypothetical protein VFL83_10070 [Anaeromyxobacter sp.]|nr:hypothetical protein [Anaeromyxobacter sp.]